MHGVTDSDDRDALHLLMVGESTAAGVGAASHATGLAGTVANALTEHTRRPVAWRVLGRNGLTVSGVRRRLPGWLAAGSADSATDGATESVAERAADVVVIVLGVNDTIRLTRRLHWEKEMAALVDDLRARVGPAQIWLAGVPPMDRFPALPQPLRFIMGERARLLDQSLAHLAEKVHRVYHLPTPLPEPHAFARDGFHPGELGYAGWGHSLVEQALARGESMPTICTEP